MGFESWRRRHNRKDVGEEKRTRSQASQGSRAAERLKRRVLSKPRSGFDEQEVAGVLRQILPCHNGGRTQLEKGAEGIVPFPGIPQPLLTKEGHRPQTYEPPG